MSGYSITKEMMKLTERRLTSGVIYPLLYDLEEKGFIIGRWVEKGRRKIKYYSITEEGLKMLESLKNVLRRPMKSILKSILGENG